MEASELTLDLRRPEAFGAPRGEPVDFHMTHASWVFLTARDVWKVKRPVDLGFLDFRTIEARRRCCEDEVRLNRRLASDVYLGVETVRRGAAGHTLVGDGQIVDWAVHMRRLPEEASAAAMLARGALDASALELVATRLAAFLDEARVTPEFGSHALLTANVEENFAQVAPFVGDLVDGAVFEQVRAFQLEALTRRQQRFALRIGENRIREGHGDLRLEHIYLPPRSDDAGRRLPPIPTIIDCIEFNERFRCGDGASEVAFLAMELEAERRPDLAAGFIARYAETSGDFGLYGVLDFYLSYRAWVRGKVAALVAGDPAAPAEARRLARAEAGRRFGLARAFAGTPVDRPFLIAVGGMIGTGKSTLAAALGRVLAVPVLASDRVRKQAAGLAPTARGGEDLYERARREQTYTIIVEKAGQVLETGRGVIVDATFSRRRWRELVAKAARAHDATFAFIEARCPEELLRQRLAARRDTASESDADDRLLAAFRRQYEPVGSAEPEPAFAADTSGSAEAAQSAVLTWLGGLGILPASERRVS
jgi:aminoglycoside phosphotransferase family enzyme/predicted kinase